MKTQNAGASKAFKLSVTTLAIMNITAVVSLRGLPSEATYGLSSAFYYLFAAIVFLIPTAMVAAELAAMFSDKQGGVFRWVGEAFGPRTGFLAIWLQWIESTIWYPTVLTFGAVSLAFIGMNDVSDAALASNKIFTLVTVLAIYWGATFIALKGLSWVGKISKIGGMVGTIIPAGLLIVLGIIYIATGGQNHMDMSQGFFPDLTKLDNLVLASGIFLFYAGMEMMGVHVMDVNNPSKNYPKAIIIGSLATVCIFVLGTFALGVIIPAKDINLTQSLLIGFDNFFRYFHISWAGPVIAIALMFGVLASVLTWVAGPSKGIFTVGKFNRGTNIANLKIAKAEQEVAVLNFQQSLLNAGAEVNNALTALQTARRKLDIDNSQVTTLQEAVRKTELLMRHSSANYLEVLTAQQTLLSAEQAVAQDRFDEIQSIITLYHALGGGK